MSFGDRGANIEVNGFVVIKHLIGSQISGRSELYARCFTCQLDERITLVLVRMAREANDKWSLREELIKDSVRYVVGIRQLVELVRIDHMNTFAERLGGRNMLSIVSVGAYRHQEWLLEESQVRDAIWNYDILAVNEIMGIAKTYKFRARQLFVVTLRKVEWHSLDHDIGDSINDPVRSVCQD
jgi:hypothetical protein